MTPLLSRRALLAGGGVAGAALWTGVAQARIRPSEMKPLIGPGYRPTERDEIGLWQQYARVEEEIAGSNILIKDPGLNRYLQALIGKVGGPAARDMRIYVARIPEFNAVMFPTGFTVIFSGLLLRMRDEAQLAGVIAHESAHFLLRHQIRQWRDMRRKSDILGFATMLGGIAGGAAGVYTGDLAQLAQLGTILSLLRYNRQLEAESDALGVRLIAEAGYSPISMSETWEQLIGEIELSAKERRKRPRRDYSIFSTHPVPKERMADLRASANELVMAGRQYDRGRERYLAQMAQHRPMLLDDQIKLNDPGASRYVVETLAKDGWNGVLLTAMGDINRLRNGDGHQRLAANYFASAVAYPDAPADAWRWHGIYLMKSGRAAEGRQALQRYLTMAPNSPDAPFVRQMIAA
ncbi:M48 family metallopeptidase [Sphingomonas sp. GCM10030256]|uniref:M48 family metallopeptidase n=1 Tax=Sphingomonas sp. GCM10030256 TaxID=3273427 RepID=UPI00360A80FC